LISEKFNELGISVLKPQKGSSFWRIRTGSQKVINNYYSLISSRHGDKIPKFEEVKKGFNMQNIEKKEKVVIGLEIHAYLDTKSKLFCSCSTNIEGKEPNSVTCPVCLSHPGSKPMLNEKAVELAIKIGLALGCEINKEFFFSRKTYFYPDLAANYQITQYEVPVAQRGELFLERLQE